MLFLLCFLCFSTFIAFIMLMALAWRSPAGNNIKSIEMAKSPYRSVLETTRTEAR